MARPIEKITPVAEPIQPRIERFIEGSMLRIEGVFELFALAAFLILLLLGLSLLVYSIFYFTLEVFTHGILVHSFEHVLTNTLHSLEVVLLSLLILLLAPLVYRFIRYCSQGETERLVQLRMGYVEKWLSSILITVVATFLMEKLFARTETPLPIYIAGVVIILSLSVFIYVAKEE